MRAPSISSIAITPLVGRQSARYPWLRWSLRLDLHSREAHGRAKNAYCFLAIVDQAPRDIVPAGYLGHRCAWLCHCLKDYRLSSALYRRRRRIISGCEPLNAPLSRPVVTPVSSLLSINASCAGYQLAQGGPQRMRSSRATLLPPSYTTSRPRSLPHRVVCLANPQQYRNSI